MHEILRLYPSVPANVKTNVKDDYLPDGTFIPAYSLVSFFPYAMGRSEKIWGTTAKQFIPERWIDEKGNIKKESPYKWPAFNAGPRTCLGQNLAMFEAVTVLAILLRKFRFEIVPDQTVTYMTSLTLPMRDGLKVHVRRR
ncbi:hypothetical protein HK102_009078 [Quaeritorhiza haematococci]|nr:hypothetical protein HK102_009078 [Quaeritorhiza haematococci]